MRVEIGNVGDVHPVLFQPKRQWKLPKEPFPRPNRQRRIDNLTVLAIRAVEADRDLWPPIPWIIAIVVQGELAGPAIISLPGRVRTLKDQARIPVVAHDENNVALPAFALGGELSEINPAQPIGRNRQPRAGLPVTIAHPLLTDGRVRLGHSLEWAKRQLVVSAFAAVVAHAVDVDCERRWRIGAHVKADALARANAGAIAIPFNPWAAILRLRINPRLAQKPIQRTTPLILAPNKIRCALRATRRMRGRTA